MCDQLAKSSFDLDHDARHEALQVRQLVGIDSGSAWDEAAVMLRRKETAGQAVLNEWMVQRVTDGCVGGPFPGAKLMALKAAKIATYPKETMALALAAMLMDKYVEQVEQVILRAEDEDLSDLRDRQDALELFLKLRRLELPKEMSESDSGDESDAEYNELRAKHDHCIREVGDADVLMRYLDSYQIMTPNLVPEAERLLVGTPTFCDVVRLHVAAQLTEIPQLIEGARDRFRLMMLVEGVGEALARRRADISASWLTHMHSGGTSEDTTFLDGQLSAAQSIATDSSAGLLADDNQTFVVLAALQLYQLPRLGPTATSTWTAPP
jgi:hypothetical protein